MIPLQKNFNISPNDISKLIEGRYATIMQAFYESQSAFLCGLLKRYQNIETANILICFARNVHLSIIRQREKDLNYDVSLENFWKNFNFIDKPQEKITSIVKITGIPKETVRRKIKNLIELGFLLRDKKNKAYYWELNKNHKDLFLKSIDYDTKNLSVFISKIVSNLKLKKLNSKIIEEEINSQFSFYWYHYLSCQIDWLKWWQMKFGDNELLLIALQALIPTLNFVDKNTENVNSENMFKFIGQINKNNNSDCSISATSIADVTGIPRGTAIRKLEKLVNLGFLIRDVKTKRYSVNQSADGRTKNILGKENVSFTIKTFSEYIAIILNSLIHNKL